jgi:hypothetical protein
MRTVFPNTTIQIIGRFYTFAGVLVDPATVTFTLRTPAGTETDYVSPAVVKQAVGVYSLDYTVAGGGNYTYRITGDNPDVTIQGVIPVQVSAFTNGL